MQLYLLSSFPRCRRLKKTISSQSVSAKKQYFHVVLFIMLYKVVLTFKSVDETLVCDHSNESY